MHSGQGAAVLGPYHNKHYPSAFDDDAATTNTASADNAGTNDATGANGSADDNTAFTDAAGNTSTDDDSADTDATGTAAKLLQVPQQPFKVP